MKEDKRCSRHVHRAHIILSCYWVDTTVHRSLSQQMRALVTATAVAAAVAATAAREDACVKDFTSVIAASCIARASASFSLYSASASSSSNACNDTVNWALRPLMSPRHDAAWISCAALHHIEKQAGGLRAISFMLFNSCSAHLVGEFEVNIADGFGGRCEGLGIHDGKPGIQRAISRQPGQRKADIAQQRPPCQVRVPHLDVQRLVRWVLHLCRLLLGESHQSQRNSAAHAKHELADKHVETVNRQFWRRTKN